MKKRLVQSVLVVGLLAVPSAAFAYNEASDGELSSNGSAPTAVAFVTGNNTVAGTLNTGAADNRDYFTFSVPAGHQLSAIRLLTWNNSVGGGPGNRGYHALSAGSTAQIPGTGTVGTFLGGDHADFSASPQELLAALADGMNSGQPTGTGFSPPLGPGTYTYVIQQTGADQITYNFQFEVTAITTAGSSVPASSPSSLVLLVGVLAAVGVGVVRRACPLPAS